MRAPVIEFSIDSDKEEFAVYTCKNKLGDDYCGAQLLQAMRVKYLTLETVSAEDDECINIYDEPTRSIISSALPIDGKIYCLKCNVTVGIRNGSLIHFDSTKLKEMTIYTFDRLISNIVNLLFSEDHWVLSLFIINKIQSNSPHTENALFFFDSSVNLFL